MKADKEDIELQEERLLQQIGAMIRMMRINNRVSAKKLAEMTGLTDKSYISRLERGLINPTVKNVMRLLAPFGMTLTISYLPTRELLKSSVLMRASAVLKSREKMKRLAEVMEDMLSGDEEDEGEEPILLTEEGWEIAEERIGRFVKEEKERDEDVDDWDEYIEF